MPKLSHKEFVERAIICLRKEGYKGIHSVYLGFNEAFKKYFDGENPVAVTKKLADEGHIYIRLAKGGALLYLSKDVPHYRSPEETLALILEKTDIKQPNILKEKEKALSLVDTAKKQFPTVKEKTIDYLITRGWNAASFKKAQELIEYSPDTNLIRLIPVVEKVANIDEALVITDLIESFKSFSANAIKRLWDIFYPGDYEYELAANESIDFLENLKDLLKQAIPINDESVVRYSKGTKQAIIRLKEELEKANSRYSEILIKILNDHDNKRRSIDDFISDLEGMGSVVLQEYIDDNI